MEWEGAVMKTQNGRLNGISIAYAQSQKAFQTLMLSAGQDGVTYIRRSGMQYAGATVRTPYASASALDTQADTANTLMLTDLPAADDVTAGRWAMRRIAAPQPTRGSITPVHGHESHTYGDGAH